MLLDEPRNLGAPPVGFACVICNRPSKISQPAVALPQEAPGRRHRRGRAAWSIHPQRRQLHGESAAGVGARGTGKARRGRAWIGVGGGHRGEGSRWPRPTNSRTGQAVLVVPWAWLPPWSQATRCVAAKEEAASTKNLRYPAAAKSYEAVKIRGALSDERLTSTSMSQ